jgi:hypothetical protein
MSSESSWLPRFLSPSIVGIATVWYAVIHLVTGVAMAFLLPSPNFMVTVDGFRTAVYQAFLIGAIGALAVALARYADLLWNHIIPELRRD